MHIRQIKLTKICWLGIAIGQFLMWQHADAASASRQHPNAPRIRINRSHETDRRETRDDYRSGYVAGLRDGKHVTAANQRSRRDAIAEEKAAIREQAERDARAERIYRSSQFSAPIIIDAKACRRIGKHGESIYENCQLTTTCNTRTGAATCQPTE